MDFLSLLTALSILFIEMTSSARDKENLDAGTCGCVKSVEVEFALSGDKALNEWIIPEI